MQAALSHQASLHRDCDANYPDFISEAEANTQRQIEAEERLLASMDLYADWIYSQCVGVSWQACRIVYVPRDPVSLEKYVESLDIPQLNALTLHPRTDARVMAMDALKAKFIEAHRDYLAKLASEVEVS